MYRADILPVWKGGEGSLALTVTKVTLEHWKGPAIKQKRKVLAILLGVGKGALVRRKKSTSYIFLS